MGRKSEGRCGNRVTKEISKVHKTVCLRYVVANRLVRKFFLTGFSYVFIINSAIQKRRNNNDRRNETGFLVGIYQILF